MNVRITHIKPLNHPPSPRQFHASCITQRRNNETFIYVLGGLSTNSQDENEAGLKSDFYRYSVLKNQWEKLPLFDGDGKAFHTMVSGNDGIIVFGGSVLGNRLSKEVWIYQEKTKSWTEVLFQTTKDFPAARMSHGMVYWKEKNCFILFGGSVGSDLRKKSRMSRDLFVLKINEHHEGSWRKISCSNIYQDDIISPRSAHVCHLYGNSLIVFGGDSHNGTQMNDTWKFNLEKRVWTQLICTGDIPSPRSCCASLICGKTLVIIGGFPYQHQHECYKLNLETLVWSELKISGDLWTRSGHSIAVNPWKNNQAFLFGGQLMKHGKAEDRNDLYEIRLESEDTEKVISDLFAELDAMKSMNRGDVTNFEKYTKEKSNQQDVSGYSKKDTSGYSKHFQKKLKPDQNKEKKPKASKKKKKKKKKESLPETNPDIIHQASFNLSKLSHSNFSAVVATSPVEQSKLNSLALVKDMELQNLKAEYEMIQENLSQEHLRIVNNKERRIEYLTKTLKETNENVVFLKEQILSQKEQSSNELELIEKQFQSEISEYLEQIKQEKEKFAATEKILNEQIVENHKTISKLGQKNQDQSNELSKLRAELEATRTMLQNDKALHKEKLQIFEERIKSKTKENQSQQDEFRENLERENTFLRKKLETESTENTSLRKQISSLERLVAQQKRDHHREIERIKATFNRNLEEAQEKARKDFQFAQQNSDQEILKEKERIALQLKDKEEKIIMCQKEELDLRKLLREERHRASDLQKQLSMSTEKIDSSASTIQKQYNMIEQLKTELTTATKQLTNFTDESDYHDVLKSELHSTKRLLTLEKQKSKELSSKIDHLTMEITSYRQENKDLKQSNSTTLRKTAELQFKLDQITRNSVTFTTDRNDEHKHARDFEKSLKQNTNTSVRSVDGRSFDSGKISHDQVIKQKLWLVDNQNYVISKQVNDHVISKQVSDHVLADVQKSKSMALADARDQDSDENSYLDDEEANSYQVSDDETVPSDQKHFEAPGDGKSVTIIVKKLLLSQELYVKSLSELQRTFVAPLKTNQMISLMDWTRLFNHFETVYTSADNFLRQIKDILRQENVNATIELFQSMPRQVFSPLKTYCNYFLENVVGYYELMEKDSFREFVQNQNLLEMIEQPLQQIQRYQHFINRLEESISHHLKPNLVHVFADINILQKIAQEKKDRANKAIQNLKPRIQNATTDHSSSSPMDKQSFIKLPRSLENAISNNSLMNKHGNVFSFMSKINGKKGHTYILNENNILSVCGSSVFRFSNDFQIQKENNMLMLSDAMKTIVMEFDDEDLFQRVYKKFLKT